MQDSDRVIIEAYNDYRTKNLPALTNSLSELTNLLNGLIKCLLDDKIEEEFWKEHLKLLLTKFSFHSLSLINIINNAETVAFNGQPFRFPDLPTIRIIVRALIENYLTIYYLFFEPKGREEAEFRFYLYQLSGLAARQKFKFYMPENIKQINEEKVEIARLEALIKNNHHFKQYPQKLQDNILKQKSARVYGWEKMIEHSDLHSEHIVQAWKLFSNNAHSELLGTIQLKGYLLEPPLIGPAACSDIVIAIGITSSLISNIRQTYPSTQKIFDVVSNDLKSIVEFWTILARQPTNSI